MTDAELEARFPWVPWRAPQLATITAGGPERAIFICRYCAARSIRHADIPSVGFWWSSADHQAHLDERHPLQVAA